MKVLNRPMFRMGGPIKEGIMDGIKEPRQGYRFCNTVDRTVGGAEMVWEITKRQHAVCRHRWIEDDTSEGLQLESPLDAKLSKRRNPYRAFRAPTDEVFDGHDL